MKPFIVSLGIIVFGVMGFTYQSDISNYLFLQEHLQALTEECAAYAALSCYENSEGEIIFYEDDCKERVNFLVNYASNRMACFRYGSFDMPEIEYSKGETYSLSVKLKFIPDKPLFRLKTVKTPEISHVSCYEWTKI